MIRTKPSVTLLLMTFVSVALAGVLPAQQAEEYLGLTLRLATCPPGLVSEVSVFLPDQTAPDALRSGPLCSESGRVDVLWAELPRVPEPGEEVVAVVAARRAASEGGDALLGLARAPVAGRSGQTGSASVPALELHPLPQVQALASPLGVRLSLGPYEGTDVMGWAVYRVAEEALAGDGPSASDFHAVAEGKLLTPSGTSRRSQALFVIQPPGTWRYTVRPVVAGMVERAQDCTPDGGTFCVSLEGEPLLGPLSDPLSTGAEGSRDLRGLDWPRDRTIRMR